MNAIDKAREVSENIKKTINHDGKEETVVKTGPEEMANAMSILEGNAELMKMYKDNAGAGSANLGGQSPLLKVFTAGRSNGCELPNGKEPNNGWFFYKPTQEQFEKVDCHILTISKGFRADGFQGKKDVFNQILAGVIVNGGATKLFIMYLTGTKLNRMWEFGKEVGKYTHARPLPIPMFALSVELSTVKETTKFGNVWVVDFKVKKNEGGLPLVITDPGKFLFLRDMVDSAEEMVAQLTTAKATEEVVEDITSEIDTDSAGNKIEDIIVPEDYNEKI